jgi:hypothetical protein
MMEVIAIDGFRVSIPGDCYETLLWVQGGGKAIVQQLAALGGLSVTRTSMAIEERLARP